MLSEDLKMFYLGLKQGEPYFYENKDLTTHAAIIGMTGSGKTGLGITLLEEAAIDKIPTIIIDPKGDLTNLCLAFNELKGENFLPFIEEEEEAKNLGISKQDLAEKTAKIWQQGLQNSHQNIDRIKLLNNNCDFTIFTPKSKTGLGISLLSDFEVPNNLNEVDLNEYVLSISSSILSLLGSNTSDPTNPEILLLQNIFLSNFKENQGVTITELINQIIKPKFNKIGVFDLETFYSYDKRTKMAMKLNALFASPSFSLWCEGEKLDISKMLFKGEKARANIFTISHLNDSERMFFVTILLNEIIRFMRTTQGTSSLRMIVYMDEIFGFFPPNSNPPSKTPMLTLLKQARAFGIGCVLSTQNPVDIDYKGLSNIGTWFIGKLQTAQDKDRIISGLSGIGQNSKSQSEIFDLISNLKKRNFLVKNINSDELITIESRFALSYLKGPLSDEQISNLMKDKKSQQQNKISTNFSQTKPILSPQISQIYSISSNYVKPYLYASAKIRYANKDFDITKDINLCLNLDDVDEINWEEASQNLQISTQKEPDIKLEFGEIPNFILNKKDFKDEIRKLKDFLYRDVKLEIYEAIGLKSNPNENLESFKLKIRDKCNEILEVETTKFQEKFQKEKAKIEEKLRRAEIRLEKEKSDLKSKGLETVLSIGSSILGAFFGGGKLLTKTNTSKIASTARNANRVLNEKKDVANAEESLEILQNELEEFLAKSENEMSQIKSKYSFENIEIKITQISAKKSDIFDEKVELLWKS